MEFENVSGNLALDLLATLWWRRDRPRDLLAGPADVESWASSVGVRLTDAMSVDDLEDVVALRELIYRECARRLAGQIPALAPIADRHSEIASLLEIARNPPTWPQLDTAGRLHQSGPATALQSLVARSALELLDGPDAARIRECGSPRCTRLFIDRSRGKRVWCGMSTCGNREKAARWRARHPASTRA
ncbi:CGNR zinc finger domain-containing protein [Acidipropionibacterium jensenii]|uniref:CGNR zinc finger domain-containing protein n=1 Tax=Acidipropionibacterium jensenii TaxID=1749 RepID=UPI00214C41B2